MLMLTRCETFSSTFFNCSKAVKTAVSFYKMNLIYFSENNEFKLLQVRTLDVTWYVIGLATEMLILFYMHRRDQDLGRRLTME